MTDTMLARWEAALGRARAAGLSPASLVHVGDGFAECPSTTAPGKRYLLCADQCSCKAGSGPVCLHRALYRAAVGLAPFVRPAAPALPFVRRVRLAGRSAA